MTRQAFVLRDPTGGAINPVVYYDPVARTVSLSNPSCGSGNAVDGGTGSSWLTVGQTYTVTLTIPANAQDPYGARAIDGQTLDPSQPDTSRVIGFPIVAPTGGGALVCGPSSPKIHFCADILFPIFAQKCASSLCHASPQTAGGGSRPAADLILDNYLGVAHTALAVRPSHGSNTGPRVVPGDPGRLFGIDMPVIDPGHPANSWMLYKLLLAVPSPPAATDGGTTGPNVPVRNNVWAQDDPERASLSEYMLGREMPYPGGGYAPLTLEELERVSYWIAQNAPACDCGSASAPPLMDCAAP